MATEEEKVQRRLTKALDTNPVICATCDVRFFDYTDAIMVAPGQGAPLAIGGCKHPTACNAHGGMAALKAGTLDVTPRPSARPKRLLS